MSKVKVTSKDVAAKVGNAVVRMEDRQKATYAVYSVKMPGYPYLPPFLAPSDDVALDCLKETASTVKEFVKSRLYKLGTFCLLDGKFVVYPTKRMVSIKEN